MKKKDVRIGATYAVKVSGRVAPVRIVGPSPYGGWVGVNEWTGRQVHIRTAGRLRYEVQPVPNPQHRMRNATYVPVPKD